MTGNDAIQFCRGTSAQRSSHTEVSLEGQPIYETDTGLFYIGDGTTTVKNLKPLIHVYEDSSGYLCIDTVIE